MATTTKVPRTVAGIDILVDLLATLERRLPSVDLDDPNRPALTRLRSALSDYADLQRPTLTPAARSVT